MIGLRSLTTDAELMDFVRRKCGIMLLRSPVSGQYTTLATSIIPKLTNFRSNCDFCLQISRNIVQVIGSGDHFVERNKAVFVERSFRLCWTFIELFGAMTTAWRTFRNVQLRPFVGHLPWDSGLLVCGYTTDRCFAMNLTHCILDLITYLNFRSA